MSIEEKKNNWTAIKCPHCNYEYLPQEIYYPDDLFGKTKQVIKDPLGKIIYVEYEEGYEPTEVEHYVCDNCEKPFVVEASVSFKVKEESPELDFSEQSVSLLD